MDLARTDIRELAVYIRTTPRTLEIVDRAFGALVEVKRVLEREANLLNLSILRGDSDFCRTSVPKPRQYPVIVLMDQVSFDTPQVRMEMMAVGAYAVYPLVFTNEQELAREVESRIKAYLRSLLID